MKEEEEQGKAVRANAITRAQGGNGQTWQLRVKNWKAISKDDTNISRLPVTIINARELDDTLMKAERTFVAVWLAPTSEQCKARREQLDANRPTLVNLTIVEVVYSHDN